MALTKKAVDEFKWTPAGGSRAQILWDEQLPGFGVRVFVSGAKSFILDYRAAGRQRRTTLGKYGVMTVEQARKKAREALVAISDGADPLDEKRREREQRAEQIAVRDFAALYITRHAKQRKRSWKEDERRLAKYIVPAFGARPLVSITRADIARLHDQIGAHAKFEANRVVALLGVVFALAEEWGYLPEGHLNPTKRVKPFTEPSRDRWVTHAEMPKLWAAIQNEPNVYIRSFLTLSLLLGTRRSELLHARWENVDLERREIRLPNTKAGNTHVLPLSPVAVEILSALPRMLRNPHVFPSNVTPGQPMQDVKRSWLRVRADAGLRDVRFHDLRRTVGSWLAASGTSLQQIGKVLNHADASTTQVYARLAESSTRAALDEHADRLLNVVTGGAA